MSHSPRCDCLACYKEKANSITPNRPPQKIVFSYPPDGSFPEEREYITKGLKEYATK